MEQSLGGALGESMDPIDQSVLDGYRFLQEEGRPDILAEFVEVFLEDLPVKLGVLDAAIASADPARIRSAAHALKGSSASLGAIHLAAACRAVETAVRAGISAESEARRARVHYEATRAREALLALHPTTPLP